MQVGVIGIADRRDGAQTVERAAQDDDDEARIARGAALAQRGIEAKAKAAPAAESRRAAAEGGASGASSLSPLKFGRQNQQRIGLLERFRRA